MPPRKDGSSSPPSLFVWQIRTLVAFLLGAAEPSLSSVGTRDAAGIVAGRRALASLHVLVVTLDGRMRALTDNNKVLERSTCRIGQNLVEAWISGLVRVGGIMASAAEKGESLSGPRMNRIGTVAAEATRGSVRSYQGMDPTCYAVVPIQHVM